LQIPLGFHINVKVVVEGMVCVRRYTPVHLPALSPIGATPVIDLLVKVYPDGVVSSRIGALRIGDTLDMSTAEGSFNLDELMDDKIGMVAGGTGITPMVDILVKRHAQRRHAALLFCNHTEEDILLRSDLDKLRSPTTPIQYMLTSPAHKVRACLHARVCKVAAVLTPHARTCRTGRRSLPEKCPARPSKRQ
jgi:cytochrome-b5 reductase